MEKAFSLGKTYTPATKSEVIEFLATELNKEPVNLNDEMMEKWEELTSIDPEAKIKTNVLELEEIDLDLMNKKGFAMR